MYDTHNSRWKFIKQAVISGVDLSVGGVSLAQYANSRINYGFHIRFDFSNYFGQLHGLWANVSEELHKYGIKFMDHYSCNHVERPRNEEEFHKLHRSHRHHVLLFHDPIAAKYAQYEEHRLCRPCRLRL